MTEFELQTLKVYFNEATASYIMNFISILSGYVLANHILGTKITRTQFTIFTFAYSIIMIVIILAVYTSTREWYSAEEALNKINRTWASQFTIGGASMAIISTTTLFVTYLGSLYFALTTRK